MKFSTLLLTAYGLASVSAVKLCFGSTESNNCEGGDFGSCVTIMGQQYVMGCTTESGTMRSICLHRAAQEAQQYCGFWCAEVKSKKQCKDVAKKVGYDAMCDGSDFC